MTDHHHDAAHADASDGSCCSSHPPAATSASVARDPVCGMTVDPAAGKPSAIFGGHSLRGSIAAIWKLPAAFISKERDVVAFQLTAPFFQPYTSLEFGKDRWSVETLPLITDTALLPAGLTKLISTRRRSETCHVLKIENEIAGWGFSACPIDAKWPINETGTVLRMSPRSLCLTGFETRSDYRLRGVYKTLLTRILDDFFVRCGRTAYICSVSTNVASLAAIKRLGFAEKEIHRFRRRIGFVKRTVDVMLATSARPAPRVEPRLEVRADSSRGRADRR